MKVANSYASLLKGVSQQVAQDRADGQHTEQVNMLSDPVNGLTRRHGSIWQAERLLSGLPHTQLSAYITDTANWLSYDYDYAGKEYVVLYRRGARPVTANPLPMFLVYNKTDKTFLSMSRNITDSFLDSVEQGGISAITGVGKYLFFAGNTTTVAGASVNSWDNSTNLERAVVWIRGGAFSRTYRVKIRKQDGTEASAVYTTPSSSYQGLLVTSDIAASDPEYTKKVNDRVNTYNGQVTQWIGTSTAAVQPAAIATQLASVLSSVGIGVMVVGSHICFTTIGQVKSLEVDDGGDGSLITGVADEIEAVDKTSIVHFVGKVVKVRTQNSAEAFYLKAIAKDKLVTNGYTEVTWVEAAGVTHTINGGLCYATIVGPAFHVASSAALLTSLTPGPHPSYVASAAGDADSAPVPYFVGKKVTYLGTFQNRLLVGSGGVLACSRTEDYLNFFRTTVLTLPASDAFEMLPQGSEDDELTASTLYDQDLVVFGKKRQYRINGNIALTPTSANMAVLASYEDSAYAPPVAAGGFIFYTKRDGLASNVFQIQPGQVQNSPESFPASSQISRYLLGNATEMVSATGSPSLLFLRTDAYRNGLYTFAYLDKQDGRKMDSWSRWEFDSAVGSVIGMSSTQNGILVMTLRQTSANTLYVVADLCPLTTDLSEYPYLDSNRPYDQVRIGAGSLTLTGGDHWGVAYDSTSIRRFTGTLLPNVEELIVAYGGQAAMRVGAVQAASVTITNPFMRDAKNKAILSGRLAITKKIVAFKDSIGFVSNLNYRNQVVSEVEFNGRILGDPNNVIGIEPISTGQYTIPVGRETRQYELTISARRWYPLTITAIEWTGQFFNRVQRF